MRVAVSITVIYAVVLSILLVLLQGLCPRAMAQVTVSADFGGRNNTTALIPGDMFGISLGALQNTSTITDLVQSAGVIRTRKMAGIPQVYATKTPNWGDLDWYMANVLKPQGANVLIVLSLTPSWLQPSSTSCADAATAPPTSVAAWAQIAASYVAHLDHTFPGLVRDYEIWNEPELQKSLCVADNSDSTRLATYLALYAAAARAMRAQATLDGAYIKIGGPTISNLTLASEWIGSLVSNSSTAPYVDFVSYHQYLTGLRQISSGMDWNMLYSFTQSSTRGEVFYYTKIRNLVTNGIQPHRWSTPIYISEYNDNWVFTVDCCRNDPTFAPLWNTVAIVDFLNTAYSGAKLLPSRIYYFAGSFPPFCIAGTWDSRMDCDPSSMQLYPQYYAFKLLAGTEYLGLRLGGRMAVSVSSANTASGLLATAFYTTSADVIVLVNPTGTAYSSAKIVANNPGLSAATGTVFELGPSSPQIATRSLALAESSGTYTAIVSVPAYSAVALRITP